MIIKHEKHFSRNSRGAQRFVGIFPLYCAFWMLIGWASKLWSRGYSVTCKQEPRSCLDHYNTGARTSSIYHIYDSEGKNYKVFCDMTSEANSVWTLVMSQSFENRALIGFRLRGLMNDKQINADEPTNWSAYRLSHQRMIDLRSKSTHWRITCSFDTYGVDYRDYIRAKFSVFDPLTFTQTKECKRVEYMNVRGHNCSDCTACWSQTDGSVMLHHRSDERMCDLGRTPDAVSNEQCFGYYYDFNRSFRCTKTNIDSTNHWFGAYV